MIILLSLQHICSWLCPRFYKSLREENDNFFIQCVRRPMLSFGEHQVQVETPDAISDQSKYYFLHFRFQTNKTLSHFPLIISVICWKYKKKQFQNVFIFWSAKHEIFPYLKLGYTCTQRFLYKSKFISNTNLKLWVSFKLFILYKEYLKDLQHQSYVFSFLNLINLCKVRPYL